MTESTYPAWQSAIREAQAKVAEANAKAAQEQEERKRQEEAEKNAQDAQHLQQVLGLLGIAIPLPECDEVTLDGVTLRLYYYHVFASAPHKFGEPPPPKDTVEFTLDVCRRIAEEDMGDFAEDLYWGDLCRTVNGRGKLEGSNWLDSQAKLANAIDYVNTSYEEQMNRLATLKAAAAQRAELRQWRESQPEPPPTPEQVLMDALKAFINVYRPERSHMEDF